MIKKLLETTVEKSDRPRTFNVIASTGQLDRDRDRIPVHAWSLDNFKTNPVILWSHDHTIPAIARAVNVRVAGKALRATIEFPPPGIHPLADTVHGLVSTGFLKAVSVGFRPSTYTPNDDGGRDYQYPVELLEISPVNLPANTGAVLERRDYDSVAVSKWLQGEEREPLYDRHGHDYVEILDESEPYLELADDLIDLDPVQLNRLITESMTHAFMGLVLDAVRERFDYARGRVRL